MPIKKGDRVLTPYGTGRVESVDLDFNTALVFHDETVYGGANPRTASDFLSEYDLTELSLVEEQ